MKRLLAISAAFVAAALSASTVGDVALGVNYEAMTVSGTAPAGETATITLHNDSGGTSVSTNVLVGLGGTFTVGFTDLAAGDQYRISVAGESKVALPAARTVGEGWVDEDDDTFNGLRAGTGAWSGRDFAKTSGGAIEIYAETFETNEETVVYMPTNALPVYRGYRVTTRASFTLARDALDDVVDGIFGVSSVLAGDMLQVAIVDKCRWQTVSRDVFAPELGETYEFVFLVDEEKRSVGYYVTTADGVVYLGRGEIAEGMNTRFRTADFLGYGAVEELAGDAYDDDLLALGLHFDDGADGGRLLAGCNFTNLNVTGWVSITNLCDTTVTSGTVRVYAIDRHGVTNEIWSTRWDAFKTRYAFTNVVDSLTAGAEYEIVTRLELDDEFAEYADRLADAGRNVANAVLAREDGRLWFDETAATVADPAASYGVWSSTGDYLVAPGADGAIAFTDSSEEELGASYALFTPTNELAVTLAATCTRLATTFEEIGDYSDLAGLASARYGITLVTVGDSTWPEFAVLAGGAWHVIPHADHPAYANIPYVFEVYVNETPGEEGVSYYVTDPSGERTLLAAFALDANAEIRPDSVKFVGNGSCRIVRGTFSDTSLVKVSVDVDGETLDGALLGGRNFTNLWLNGSVAITNLWRTDLSSGRIRLTITDSHGNSRELWTTNWSEFTSYGFTNLVEGLDRGESYTIDVHVDPDDASRKDDIVGEDDWSRSGVMARDLEGRWYDENGLTATRAVAGTGVWTTFGGFSVAAAGNGGIDLETNGESDTDYARFVPTNPVPANVSVSRHRATLKVDGYIVPGDLPDVSAAMSGFAFTVDDADNPVFAYVDGGVWKFVSRDDFAPVRDETYGIDVVFSKSGDGYAAVFFVTQPDGASFAVARAAYAAAYGAYPSFVNLYGEGNVRDFSGDIFDPTLVRVDVDFGDGSMAGTNFTALIASGTVTVTPLWDTDLTNIAIRVRIRDAVGQVVHEEAVISPGSGSVCIDVEGLQPGAAYTVETEVESVDGTTGNTESVPTARKYAGTWIDEDADTFRNLRPRSGDWFYNNSGETPQATVVTNALIGAAISIETGLSEGVLFDATNATAEVLASTVREIRFTLDLSGPGFFASDDTYPSGGENDIAGITVVNDDRGEGEVYRYAVYSTDNGGSWTILDETEADVGEPQDIVILLEYANPNRSDPAAVTYYVEDANGNRTLLKRVQPANGLPAIGAKARNAIRFAGVGSVASIQGDCYDAHLARVDKTEYWTIGDAIDAIGDRGKYLVPLWYSHHSVTNTTGRFGVLDRNVPPYLTLEWPLGYLVEITVDGDVRYYYYFVSDYWLDWADPSGVTATASGYDVADAAGLAWLAKESTNRWLEAEIRLTADLTNLFEHIWSPIAGFTGTFDGGGHAIAGLRNGPLALGATNALGITAYGLFGSASNSVFRNVTISDLAVTNASDAVAAILGCAIGDLAVTNVFAKSGTVDGRGAYVAGLVGCVAEAGTVSIAASTITGRIVAGLANLGPAGADLASVTVVSNENRGAIVSSLDLTAGAGNFGQILDAGDATLKYASATATDNVGTGDVSRVAVTATEGGTVDVLPVVNFAAAVAYVTEIENLKQYIEANNATDITVDPFLRTARMSGSWYFNGETNEIGRLNDQISRLAAGGTVALDRNIESWGPVIIDRPVNVNLNGHVIDNVFENYAFYVTDAATGAAVYNGTVTSKTNMFANLAPVAPLWTTNNLRYIAWNCDYWERGLLVNDQFVQTLPAVMAALANGAALTVTEDSIYSIDTASGALMMNGQKALSLAPLGYTVSEGVDESGDPCYVIELDENPAETPTINLSLAPNGETSHIVVAGARADCEYCLQSVGSLAEDWDKPTDDWRRVASDGDSLDFTLNTSGDSGFYRIKVRKQ